MCLLSYYEAGIIPNAERLCNGAEVNADGHGYAIATRSGTLLTGHGMNSAQVIAEFTELRKQHHDGPALFHSRFSTGGLMNEDNCHPYQVGRDKKTVLAHNGVLFHVKKGETRSDTRIFAERIMPGQYIALDRVNTQRRLEAYLGKFNKIAVVTVNPRYQRQGYLFNEAAGVRLADGEWHSNYDYMPFTYTYGHYASSPARTTVLRRQDRRMDCEYCGAFDSVDEVTLTCDACLTCWDCGMPTETLNEEEGTCQCFVPLKDQKAASTDGTITWEQYVALRDGEKKAALGEAPKPGTITFTTALVPLPRVPAVTSSALVPLPRLDAAASAARLQEAAAAGATAPVAGPAVVASDPEPGKPEEEAGEEMS